MEKALQRSSKYHWLSLCLIQVALFASLSLKPFVLHIHFICLSPDLLQKEIQLDLQKEHKQEQHNNSALLQKKR